VGRLLAMVNKYVRHVSRFRVSSSSTSCDDIQLNIIVVIVYRYNVISNTNGGILLNN
jgi:hypothetical protein